MFVVARLGVILLTVAAGAAAVLGPWGDPEPPAAKEGAGLRAGTTISRALTVAVGGGLVALGVLAWAFLTEDWRFATVVGHARPDVPWTLRAAAIWAGPEGSLLLWTTMTATAALAARRLSTSAVPARLLAVTAAGYGLVVATVADPFERLAAPPGAGDGLSPVLEHPAMLWHPPVLYIGLVGMLVPTALAVGGSDLRRVRALTWTLPLALALLTAGLATGANWAYVELGWGGYWAWDPIENAGLVAWLAGASVLHRLGGDADDNPGPLPLSVATVAVIPGIAAVWATTITRTGLLNSVHAFADRPTLRFLLLTIAVAFTALTGGLAVRRHRGQWHGGGDPGDDRPPPTPVRSVAGFTAAGAAALVVAVGTYEPALEMLVRSETFTVSGRFYSMLLWPIAVVGAGFRVRAAMRSAARTATTSPTRTLIAATAGALIAMLVVTADAGPAGLALAAAGGSVVGSVLLDRWASRSGGGSRLAHIGIGILLVGIAGTMAATTETVVVLSDTAATTSVGVVRHRGVEIVDGDGTSQAVASVDVTVDGHTRRFHPRLVSYVATGGQSAEIDTDRGWLSDTQVVLVDADAAQATYRISRQPRIAFVWLGAVLTTIGLVATATTRRRWARLESQVETGDPRRVS